MMKNYTAIDELVTQYTQMKQGVGSVSKEVDLPRPSVESDEVEIPLEQRELSEEPVENYVSPKSKTITLPPDLKKLGLKTKEENQFNEILNKVKLPISDDKIMEDLKAPPSEAKRWFATILLYILERAHVTLKKVGAKTVRIFKTN